MTRRAASATVIVSPIVTATSTPFAWACAFAVFLVVLVAGFAQVMQS